MKAEATQHAIINKFTIEIGNQIFPFQIQNLINTQTGESPFNPHQ